MFPDFERVNELLFILLDNYPLYSRLLIVFSLLYICVLLDTKNVTFTLHVCSTLLQRSKRFY